MKGKVMEFEIASKVDRVDKLSKLNKKVMNNWIGDGINKKNRKHWIGKKC